MHNWAMLQHSRDWQNTVSQLYFNLKKRVWCWHKDRHEGQWYRTESPKVKPQDYNRLILLQPALLRYNWYIHKVYIRFDLPWASLLALMVKHPPVMREVLGSMARNPLQYSYLENSMDRGAWWATVRGVTKSQIRLSDWDKCKSCEMTTQ